MILLNNYWNLYWLTRLDYLQGFFQVIMVLGIVFIALALIFGWLIADVGDFELKDITKHFKWIIPVTAISGLLMALTPTRNEMIVIVAGGKTMDYIQSDTSLKKIPYQTTTIISDYLDKTIKELKDEKQK